MDANKTFEGAKVFAIFAAGGIVLFVIWKIYKGITAGIEGVEAGVNNATSDLGLTQSKDAIANSTAALKGGNLAVNTKKLSFTNDSYNRMASQMYTAMEGVGTDSEAIKSVMGAMKTQDDWNQVIQSFGIKKDENLIDWLRDAFNSTSASFLNGLVRANTLGLVKPVTASDLNAILMKNNILHNHI
jgi:hypothetical protein